MLRTVTAKPLVRSNSTHFVQHPHVGSLYTVAARCAPARVALNSTHGRLDRSDRLVMESSLSSKSQMPTRNPEVTVGICALGFGIWDLRFGIWELFQTSFARSDGHGETVEFGGVENS